MRQIGVDPGKQGALCLLDEDDEAIIRLVPMPLLRASTIRGKKRGRDEYDLQEIHRQILQWTAGGLVGFVTVEKSQPMPPRMPGGGLANFQRGVMRGWEWMLVGIGLPYQLVAPRTWQKVMHAGTPDGDTKQRSVIAAQRLFPGVSLRRSERSRKDDDGCAEALLLAEFGRRTTNGNGGTT